MGSSTTLGALKAPTKPASLERGKQLVKTIYLGGNQQEAETEVADSPVAAPEVFRIIGFTPKGKLRIREDNGTNRIISMAGWLSQKRTEEEISEKMSEAAIDVSHSPAGFQEWAQ